MNKVIETPTERILVLDSNISGKKLKREMPTFKKYFQNSTSNEREPIIIDEAKIHRHRLMIKLAAGELTSIGEHQV